MKPLILSCAALLSALLAFLTNWLALKPWRRAAVRHWSERARLLFPVRRAASSNLWVLPAVLSLGAWLALPEESPHWSLLLLASAFGAVAGTIPMDREIFPRIPLAEQIRQCALAWVIRFVIWGVFLTAIALMPDEFGGQAILILLAVLLLLFFWSRSGWVWLCRWLGLFVKPPDRLLEIVRATAAKMNVMHGEVWLMRSPFALAYAMPGTRRLLFAERLLEVLRDDEISAVCAHELAHLTEKRSEYRIRYIGWLTFLPWIFLHPMIHCFGVPGFYVLIGITVLAPRVQRGISRRLEARADSIAHANETESGVYARALARLYEDSLLPAVNAQRTATHPDLYDRLEGAGVTPDFPRPARPEKIAWHGTLFALVLGFVAMLSILKYLYDR